MMLPATYFVARDASLVRVGVHDADELRLLRTELELLRRIHQLASAWHGARRIDPKSGPAPDKYTPKDRDELENILRDAAHPIIEVMAAQLDGEFRGIRKDIVMSVVNKEAENIVQESLESGVLGGDRGQQQTGTLPPALDDALAQAEAQLAKAVATPTETALESPAEPDPAPPQPELDAAAVTSTPIEPYTPQRAEQAVVEIEKGIRKLATLLSTEVSEQWHRAKHAFDETTVARAKTDEASGKAQSLMNEIAKLKEEAAIALDEINLIRREAKLLREDTKRAKQRADASADAAELAADQVQREVESMRTTQA